MIGFLDSDVLIDAQRAQPAAATWLAGFSGPLALPAAVALELRMGSRNKEEMARNERSLQGFDVEPFDAVDPTRAARLIVTHKLATGLGLGDLLIAAQVLNRGATLFTFNLKHFRAIPGLDARMLYAR